ncbi:Nose resistant to fluoxetine protein [Schistosoma japonicum]|uniref:Nose resistant to fluoxetine protein n=1 Tax=Schistosoma japonicum TaxID=6182 RepID=A0A4Z2DGW5_SCHJA|nr:Nose resistant to fluoxetine protein [Schistosoma japonicum]
MFNSLCSCVLALGILNFAYTKELPLYSYHNSMLKLIHLLDLDTPSPFLTLMNCTWMPAREVLPYLNVETLKNNLLLNHSLCADDVASILHGISQSNEEAMKWLDAAGKIVPGVSGGAINWVGSMELCRHITDFNYGISQHVQGMYCSVYVKLPPSKNIPEKLSLKMNYGVCIPRSCTKNDILWLLNMVFSRTNLSLDNSASFCHEELGQVPKDSWFWVAVSLLAIVAFLLISGTMVDVVLWCLWNYHFHVLSYSKLINTSIFVEASITNGALVGCMETTVNDTEAEQTSEPSNLFVLPYFKYRSLRLLNLNSFVKYIATYSVCYNTFRLLHLEPSKVPNKSNQLSDHPLLCLDGIRFLTMNWIIYGHCIVFSLYSANNTLLYSQNHYRTWAYQVIIGSTLSVDTFFFMSGLLSSYLSIPKLRQIFYWKHGIKFWFGFIFHRILRLTPAYFLVLIMYTGLFIHAYVGPLYPQTPNLMDIKFCRDHWWVTYLNNFIYSDEVCMGWSWYLSNEFQFSIVLAPIFLSLVVWNETVGVLFGIGLVISSIAATFALSYANDYLPGILSINSFATVYTKPYTRWNTYSIGLLSGWFLEKHINILQDVGIKMKVMLALIGICLSSIFCVSTVYGLYGLLSGKVEPFSTVGAAAYTAFHRPIFVLGVAIVVSMCALGCGGPIRSFLTLSVFRVPARLTFTAYLVHPIVVMFIALGGQNPVLLDDLYLTILFIAVLPISYFVGFIISLATELPISSMTHIFWLKKTSSSNED